MLVQFSVSPAGQAEGLHDAVARVLRLVDESGLPYQFTAMSTLVEGDWDAVIGLIRRCHDELRGDFPRVITEIKIDDRAGRTTALTDKVAAVEKALGRRLRTGG